MQPQRSLPINEDTALAELYQRHVYMLLNLIRRSVPTRYDSSCSGFTASNCSIVGIDPSNGAQRWLYATPQGSSWITVQNGVVYGDSYSQYFALNGTTGAPIWQKTLANNAQASMTPPVSNGVLYFSVCFGNSAQNSSSATTPMIPFSGSPMQPRSGFTNCDFSAFSAANGARLWTGHGKSLKHSYVKMEEIYSLISNEQKVVFASAVHRRGAPGVRPGAGYLCYLSGKRKTGQP